jgi:hypothetical protein
MNPIADLSDTDEIIETMWGDPNRRDDWQRRFLALQLLLALLQAVTTGQKEILSNKYIMIVCIIHGGVKCQA